MALAAPTRRGRKYVPPQSGCRPRRLKTRPKEADADHVVSTAREFAVTFAAKAPLALSLARQAVHESFSMTLKDVLTLEIENQLRCFPTDDAKEGIRAFLDKRRPAFRGQ